MRLRLNLVPIDLCRAGLAVFIGVLCPVLCAQAKVLTVGPGKSFATLSAAVAVAADGDTIRLFPKRYLECAVLHADRLTIEGVGDPSSVAITDTTCEGKALLVITGKDVTIRNLTLARARVADGNGAGIRAEGGSLTVDRVQFVNNEDGILTIDNPAMVLRVTHSLFEKNGACGQACAHAIYAGHIAELDVDGSLFRDTQEGHDIKSRAARTVVTNCNIAEGTNGTGSYLIELPNGGALLVRHNLLEKGPKTGNQSAAISIGAEGATQDTPDITVQDNHVINDGTYRTVLLNNLTATPAKLGGNQLDGPVDLLKGAGR